MQQSTKISMIKHTVESGLRKRTARRMGGWKCFKCISEYSFFAAIYWGML